MLNAFDREVKGSPWRRQPLKHSNISLYSMPRLSGVLKSRVEKVKFNEFYLPLDNRHKRVCVHNPIIRLEANESIYG